MSQVDASPLKDEGSAEELIWARSREVAHRILLVKDGLHISREDGYRLRKVVLDELNDFADLCVALAAANSNNDLVVRFLRDIHAAVVGQEAR